MVSIEVLVAWRHRHQNHLEAKGQSKQVPRRTRKPQNRENSDRRITKTRSLIASECDYGSLTPSNIQDSDYNEPTEEPPPARPLTEWTDSLVQIALATSMAQPIRAISLIQNPCSGTKTDPNEIIKEGCNKVWLGV